MRPSPTPPSPTSETLPAWPGRRLGAGTRDPASVPFALPEEPTRPAAPAPEPSPARRSAAEDKPGGRRESAPRPNEDRRSARAETRAHPAPSERGGSRRAHDVRKAHSSQEDRRPPSTGDAAAAEEPDADPAPGCDGDTDAVVPSQADGRPVDPDGNGSSDEGHGDTDDPDEGVAGTEAAGSADAAAAALAALVPPSEPGVATPDGTADAAPSADPVGPAAASLPKDLPVPAAPAEDAGQPSTGAPKAGIDDPAIKDGALPEPRGSTTEPDRRDAAPERDKVAHRHPDLPAQAALFKTDAASAGPGPAVPAPAQAGGPGAAGQTGQAAPANQTGQAPTVPVLNQVPLGAVPIEIGLKSLAGVNRFEIRLDPAELGRIDVRLDIGDGGEVKAHLVVDRVETLALLQRDAKTLERAFEQAGLKPSEGSIDLSLRDPGSDRRGSDPGGDEQGRQAKPKSDEGPSLGRAEAIQQPRRTTWRGAVGVDLRI